MTGKIKRRSLRCGGRPKADFGSLFTSVIAPAFNAAGSIADESIDNNKAVTNGIVNNNTTIPSDPTKTPTMRLGGRKKCWIGTAIGAATSIVGSLFGNSAQKREMRRQQSIRDWQDATQEAANMTSVLNNSRDYQEDYLRQFRTAARLGKTLGAKSIYITDGGDATKISNNTYLLRGGSHEDVNETGQTGIGINVGDNEVEAEGGEVAQKKNGALRIFSAQPILSNGMSPAQAILRGYNKDKVFNQQQAFKKRNGLKDDGSKAQIGGYYGANYPSPLSLLSVIYDKTLGRFDNKNPFLQTGTAPTPSRGLNLKQVRSGLVNRNMLRTNRVYRIANMREVKDAKATGQYRKLPEDVTLPTKTVRTRSGRTFEFGKAGGNSHGGKAAAMGEPWTGTTSGGYNESRYVISTPSRHTVWQVGHHGSYSKPLPADAIKKGSGLWKKFDAEGNTGISTKRMVVYKDLGNDRYLRLAKSKYRLGGRPKAAFGDWVTGTWNFLKQYRSPITNLAALAAAYQKFYPNSNYNKQKGKFGGGKGFNGSGAGGSWTNVKPATRKFNNFNDAYDDAVNRGASIFKFGNKLYNTKAEGNPIREINNRAVGSYRDTIMTNNRGKNYGVDFGPIKGPATLIPLIYDTYDRPRKIHRLGGGLTSKDRGSSKYPYPSVSSKDFAGGGRSYPIPTKADAVDALRLAGLHGRSDVRSKVYSKYPSLRKKSLLGSSNHPVKSMRPKALGGMYIPFNKRYTSIYDAPDYDSDYNGGNVLGNGEVTVTAKRIKPTFMKPNNDAMNLIKVPKEEVPYIPQKYNRSRTIFSGGDYLGLGIDTLAALSTGLVNYNTAGKYTLPDRAPIIQASKLPTTYNVNPEIEEVKRYRDRLTGQTFNNTSSSVAALNRSGAINLDALSNLSKLWATKENEENKMLTEDAKNQQTVAAQNIQNELARQSEIARIKNEAIQAKGDALNVGLSGLSQAWTNFWTAGRTAYEDDQARRAMVASSKDATPTRLIEMGYDLSPDLVASLYGTAKDDRTKRFYLSRLSSAQRQKYGIN